MSRYWRIRTSARTVPRMTFPAAELSDLLDAWVLHLRAENKSLETVKSYRQGVAQFIAWAEAERRPATLDRPTVNAFVVSQLDAGRSAGTVIARQLAVRQFSAWLASEGETATDGLLGLKAPKNVIQPMRPLSEDELKALFAACKGNSFVAKRDEALARFMNETFTRANDTLSMTVADTDPHAGQALVIGKGRRPRIVAFGPTTGVALLRYLRARKTHRLAATGQFWLGGGGKDFGYDALYSALCRRAEAAGIDDFHPHSLRRTGATRWLENGGSETGLRAAAGWTSMRMVQRYTEFTSQTRAAEEARKLNLGDL